MLVQQAHLTSVVHKLLQLLLAVILPEGDSSRPWGHGAPCTVGPSCQQSHYSFRCTEHACQTDHQADVRTYPLQ